MNDQSDVPMVQKSNRLVVRIFGVVGAVVDGPAAIAGLVVVILILGCLSSSAGLGLQAATFRAPDDPVHLQDVRRLEIDLLRWIELLEGYFGRRAFDEAPY